MIYIYIRSRHLVLFSIHVYVFLCNKQVLTISMYTLHRPPFTFMTPVAPSPCTPHSATPKITSGAAEARRHLPCQPAQQRIKQSVSERTLQRTSHSYRHSYYTYTHTHTHTHLHISFSHETHHDGASPRVLGSRYVGQTSPSRPSNRRASDCSPPREEGAVG